jgi:hypothetical protein
MRQSFGVGTPRGLQGRLRTLLSLLIRSWPRLTILAELLGHHNHPNTPPSPLGFTAMRSPAEAALTTGC